MLECVINISEGTDLVRLGRITDAGTRDLLDVHADPDHNRSVLTTVGTDAAREITRAACAELDLGVHVGVHPRLGVVDVVPFVPLAATAMAEAVSARDDFARWAADELAIPCFLYGPERTLPDVRRRAFVDLAPDVGPDAPHPTAGAICVGARQQLVAYNLWLADTPLDVARAIAASLRCTEVRALGLRVGSSTQVSVNLVDPLVVGPMEVHDEVARTVPVARAELVGLIGAAALARIPRPRWESLDLSWERTIEAGVARWALGRA